MSDTTTTLNPASGGDAMDEELITQAGDGVTQAKRPRVVIAGKTGASIADPTNTDPGASPYAVPALAVALVNDAPSAGYVAGELRATSLTTDGRLRVAAVQSATHIDMFGDTGPIKTDPRELEFAPMNPWGF